MTDGGPPDVALRLDDDHFRTTWDDPDPWGFEHRWYERRKRDLTLAVLPDPRFGTGFEPGCAQGLLTRELAARCDHLYASDVVESVAQRARERCGDLDNVTVRTASLPTQWPTGSLDLVVASEVLYYLTPRGFEVFQGELGLRLARGGVVVGVHWRGESDSPLTGDEVHRRLDACSWLETVATHREPDFALDVWRGR